MVMSELVFDDVVYESNWKYNLYVYHFICITPLVDLRKACTEIWLPSGFQQISENLDY